MEYTRTLSALCEELGVPVAPELLDLKDLGISQLTTNWSPDVEVSAYFSVDVGPEQVDDLVARGVRVFVDRSERHDSSGRRVPTIVHPEPRVAYAQLMKEIRTRSNARTIAVTGSNGKTTSREMIRLVAGARMRTHWDRGSGNVLGFVGAMIQRLQTDAADAEVYVQETGAMYPGYVQSAAQMLAPDAALVTNIGMAHSGPYGGQEGVLADKISFDKYLATDGVMFINYDDSLLRSQTYAHRVISFAIDFLDADYIATDIRQNTEGISFSVLESGTGIRTPMRLAVLGRHNVMNALGAFAVGRWLRLSHEEIANALSQFRTTGTRQNLVELGGRKVLVDCYNSTDLAVRSVATTLVELDKAQNGKRVLVLGDIPRLGAQAEEVHRSLGRYLALVDDIDRVYCIGPSNRVLVDELVVKGRAAYHFETKDMLHRALATEVGPNDVLAFKAGSPTALVTTVDRLFGTDFLGINTGHIRSKDTERGGLRYRIIEDYGASISGQSTGTHAEHLLLGGYVDEVPVLQIGRKAFQRAGVVSVSIQYPVRGLALGAFYRCRNLRQVTLPSSLRFIGAGAFNGCSSLESINIPEGTTTIRSRAFNGCSALQTMLLPRSVRTVDEGAFRGCSHLTIYCYSGSVAAEILPERMPIGRVVVIDASEEGI